MRYRALYKSHGFLDRYWEEGDISEHTDEIPPKSKRLARVNGDDGDLFEPLSDFETQLVDAKEQGHIGQTYFQIEQGRLKQPKVGVNARRKGGGE